MDLGLFDTWTYGLLWTPGVVRSVNRHIAVSRQGGLRTWDEWTTEAWKGLPRQCDTREQLWMSSVELLERNAHLG